MKEAFSVAMATMNLKPEDTQLSNVLFVWLLGKSQIPPYHNGRSVEKKCIATYQIALVQLLLGTSRVSRDVIRSRKRKKDYENFLCSLLLPTKLRQYAIVLRAFNAEISTVEDQVTENITGLMRFQFWEDAVNRLYGGTVPEHPICQELIKVIRTNEVSKIHFLRPILSRRKFLKKQFKSLEEAEEHSDWSISSLYYLLLELNGVKNIDADHAASHLGRAQGLSIILRSVSRNSQRNVVTLPQEIMLKHGVSQEDILRNKVNVQTKDLAFDLATSIHQHLTMVKRIQSKIKRDNRRLYLPAVPIQSYLKKLRSADFNMFDPRLQQRDQWLTFKLLYRRLIL